MTARRGLWALIGAATALRLAWAAALGPGNDEAYHYLYTAHPSLSYFDHPPMVALVEAAGLVLVGGGASVLGLRLGFVALAAGSTWLMFRLASRFYGPAAGLAAAFLLTISAYFGAAAATFALPNGPLGFFWLLTLDRLAAALDRPESARPWVGVGLAWGGAMLSKYHAALLPAGFLLYLAITPGARRWLRRPGPYLAVAIGLAMFAPVLAWNASNGWASFAFQGGRALGSIRPRPDALAAAVGGQAAYLFPWIWLPLVVTLYWRIRAVASGEGEAPGDRFLACQAVLPLAAFGAVACVRPILPHWPLEGYLAVFPMLGRACAGRFEAEPRKVGRLLAAAAAVPVLAAAVATVHARTGLFQLERAGGVPGIGLVPAEVDPTLDLRIWPEVAGELARRGLLGRPDTFLFTSKWFRSGQLAFALGGSEPVLCYNPRSAHGFAYWSDPAEWVGKDGILVAVEDPEGMEAASFAPWFESVEPLEPFEVARAGVPVRRVQLFRLRRQTRPFPYDNDPDASIQAARADADRPGAPARR